MPGQWAPGVVVGGQAGAVLVRCCWRAGGLVHDCKEGVRRALWRLQHAIGSEASQHAHGQPPGVCTSAQLEAERGTRGHGTDLRAACCCCCQPVYGRHGWGVVSDARDDIGGRGKRGKQEVWRRRPSSAASLHSARPATSRAITTTTSTTTTDGQLFPKRRRPSVHEQHFWPLAIRSVAPNNKLAQSALLPRLARGARIGHCQTRVATSTPGLGACL